MPLFLSFTDTAADSLMYKWITDARPESALKDKRQASYSSHFKPCQHTKSIKKRLNSGMSALPFWWSQSLYKNVVYIAYFQFTLEGP